ncbi:MAG: hypothetical protein ACOCXH_08140 [Cyclobacteriaceae bacterium]
MTTALLILLVVWYRLLAFVHFFGVLMILMTIRKNYHIIWTVVIYSAIWEPLGLLGIHGTFDWKDILAVIISGLVTLTLKNFIESKFKLSRNENE